MSESNLPEGGHAEAIRALARLLVVGTAGGLTGGAPGAGAAVVGELFGLLRSPLDQRRQEWFEDVAQKLRVLEDRIDGLEQRLAGNPVFLTIILQATQAALRNHDDDKRVALRNAVLNAAVSSTVEPHMQEIFIRLIDELTPLHLRLLRYLSDPHPKPGYPPGQWPAGGVFNERFPELAKDWDLAELLVRTLNAHHLIKYTTAVEAEDHYKLGESATTGLGKSFLAYLEEPRVEETT